MPQQLAKPLEKSTMANYKPKNNLIKRAEADEDIILHDRVPRIPFGEAFDVFEGLAYKLDKLEEPNWKTVAYHVGYSYELIEWIPNLDSKSCGITSSLKFFNYYAKMEGNCVQDIMLALWVERVIDALEILQKKFPQIDIEQYAAERGKKRKRPLIPQFLEEGMSEDSCTSPSAAYYDDELPPPPGHEIQEEPLNLSRTDLRNDSPVDLSTSRYERFHDPNPTSVSKHHALSGLSPVSDHIPQHLRPLQDRTVDSSSVSPNMGACHIIGSQIVMPKNYTRSIHKPNGAIAEPRRRQLSQSEPAIKRPHLVQQSSQYPHGITHPSYSYGVDTAKDHATAPHDLEIRHIEPHVFVTDPRHQLIQPAHAAHPAHNGTRDKTHWTPDADTLQQLLRQGKMIQSQNSSTPGVIYQVVQHPPVRKIGNHSNIDNCNSSLANIQHPLYASGENHLSVIRGDCQDPSCKACLMGPNSPNMQMNNLQKFDSPKAMPLLVPGKKMPTETEASPGDLTAAYTKHKYSPFKQNIKFVPKQGEEQHLYPQCKSDAIPLQTLNAMHADRDAYEDDQYTYISRTYPGCKTSSRSPLHDLSGMKHELQRVISQQECKMSEFNTKQQTDLRIYVLTMDDLTREAKDNFFQHLHRTIYDDVRFRPCFLAEKDGVKRMTKYFEKASFIVWCGSAKLKQMLEGNLSTGAQYTFFRDAFIKSLNYKEKIIRVVFPEQPSPQDAFPFQIRYEGKVYCIEQDWDDLVYFLRQPRKLAEKISKNYKTVDKQSGKQSGKKFLRGIRF